MIPKIAEFQPNSMIEWEDRLAGLIILQGCNFRCPFCHSAKFIPPGDPETPVPWDVVRDRLESDHDWIDGVVVTGGEPTIHASLEELLRELREMEFDVKLDTNGSAPARVKRLVEDGLVQHVALDVKAPLTDEAYAISAGREGWLAAIEELLSWLKEGHVSYELRTTLFPLVFDDEEKVYDLAREISWATRWYIQGFRPVGCLDPALLELPETDFNWLERVAAKCREIAPGAKLRGDGA